MDYKAVEKRLLAAQSILHADSVNRAAFDSLKTLLSGIHPKLDKVLAEAGKAFGHVEHLQKGDVIELVLESLPDTTPEDKKRKKAILLFLKFWNDLKSEVARAQKEFAKDTDTKHHSNAWGNVLGAAKGPLGIISVIAAGVVLLQISEVSVAIKNVGCDPITPPAVNIPGLKLPGVISTGGEAVAKMPPISFTVDATVDNAARVSILGVPYSFDVGSRIHATFDGKSLIGAKTDINLGSQKEHTLIIQCQ